MTAYPVVPRELARRDVESAVDYYLEQQASSAAMGLIDALEEAYLLLGQHSEIGSHRYAHEVGIPELRCWALARFPYLIFYVRRADHIDVLRVLHSRRDIPPLMQSAGEI